MDERARVVSKLSLNRAWLADQFSSQTGGVGWACMVGGGRNLENVEAERLNSLMDAIKADEHGGLRLDMLTPGAYYQPEIISADEITAAGGDSSAAEIDEGRGASGAGMQSVAFYGELGRLETGDSGVMLFDTSVIIDARFTWSRSKAAGKRTDDKTPLGDFLIGAHASAESLPLVTRDPDRVRSYFPRVALVIP